MPKLRTVKACQHCGRVVTTGRYGSMRKHNRPDGTPCGYNRPGTPEDQKDTQDAIRRYQQTIEHLRKTLPKPKGW